MKVVRHLFYFFVAWGCTVVFFDSSIYATIILMCLLEIFSSGKFNGSRTENKRLSSKGKIAIVIELVLSGSIIILGDFIFDNDYMVIIGAILFSIVIAYCLEKFISRLIQKIVEK